MNWFTHVTLSDKADKESAFVRLDDYCEHVEGDHSKLKVISKEHDSMGSESYGVCQECWDAIQKERDEEEGTCHDCKQVFKMKELKEWRWYDFYEPQGDEPLLLCESCLSSETHQHRVAKDKSDYELEVGREEDTDNYYG